MTANLTTVRHLFISYSGEMLPRWQEAFPTAQVCPAESADTVSGPFDLLWLRLHPGLPFAGQISSVRQQFGNRAYIILSDIPSDNEALAAFSVAARGYCNSHAVPAILQQVALVVMQGGIWVGESLMQRLVAQADNLVVDSVSPPQAALIESLTPRELEVAQAIVSGDSNREIAARLGISERTVKAHVSAILDKLQVRDRLQLALLLKNQVFA